MKKIIITIGLLVPSVTFAAGNTIKDFAGNITKFLGKPLMMLLFSVALLLFIWGIAQFVKNAENSDERNKGKQHMLWGIVALFAMLTFLGLTGTLTQTFFGTEPLLPQFYENNN
ncbi:MAG: hypothetical protein LR005_02140 [Candidatus Pacebacteria bacterium]|nr:hypothetical protein [Candidatus Paceibacterota bacterium]